MKPKHNLKELSQSNKEELAQAAQMLLDLGFEENTKPKPSLLLNIKYVYPLIKEKLDKRDYKTNVVNHCLSDVNFLCGKIYNITSVAGNGLVDTVRVSSNNLSPEYLAKKLGTQGFHYEHKLVNPKTGSIFYIGLTTKWEI